MPEGSSKTSFSSNPLRWFPEFLHLSRTRFESQGRVLGAAVLVGLIAGLGAVAFNTACNVVVYYALETGAGYVEEDPPEGEKRLHKILGEPNSPFRPWLLLVIPTIGGIISGYLVFRYAPEAEGHGTDGAIAAYHYKQGYIRPRVPLIKIFASAITIGTGGSGGREGPIAQIGAGFGSFLGRLLKLRPVECRILLAAGVAAGIAAIFRAPLAGALFAAEVMYRSPEFESEVIIPAGIASVVSYCTFGVFFGWEPIFSLDIPLSFSNPLSLIPYLVLGVLMAFLAMFYTRTFYGITKIFRKIPISPFAKPPLGAFLSGALALGLYFGWQGLTELGDYLGWQWMGKGEHSENHLLSVLSFGYGILQSSFNQSFANPTNQIAWGAVAILLLVAFGKIFTTSLTIGSGGSGGVFGPSMVIGGCGGMAFGLVVHGLYPSQAPEPAAFMIVGMAGFFAAAGKVPFSTLIIVSEITGDYFLLLPTLWVCSICYLLSDEQSIYESQVENRSRSPAHKGEYVREVLTGLSVSQFVKPDSTKYTIHPEDSLTKVVKQLSDSPYSVLPVVDENSQLLGVVVLEEVYLVSQSPNMKPWILAADMMRSGVRPLRGEYTLDLAQECFVQNDLSALPVIDNRNRVTGIVKRSDLSRMYLLHVHGPAESEQAGFYPPPERR